jgi:alpha-N-arabinofuranosidase
VCTLIDKLGNFVITAKNPKGPWSNPVALPQVDGIDPSLYFNDDGKAYMVYNSVPPDNKTLYDGHRTIRMIEFDQAATKVTGTEKIIVNGVVDINKKPVWIEGPHILKKDGWYYLICAEGGTGYNHSEVVFRSKAVDGPYIPYEKNPILTQRQLDPLRKNPVTTTGHADFTEGPDGKWWAVFLGCRPYERDYYNTGRETFMAPVEWKEGWPVIELGGETVKYSYPVGATVNNKLQKFNGNHLFRDEFNTKKLNDRFIFLRTKRKNWYAISPAKGELTMQLQPETCSGKGNPSFIGFRQSHLRGFATTELIFDANSEKEKAGLLIFQNETHFYFLCKSIWKGKPALQLFRGVGDKQHPDSLEMLAAMNLTEDKARPIVLKIEADGDKYNFYYGQRGKKWQLFMGGLNGKYLSTKEAGGFVGSIYALYATSSGETSVNKARFSWFECNSNDNVYKEN